MAERGSHQPSSFTEEEHKKMLKVSFGRKYKKDSSVQEAEATVREAFGDWTERAGMSQERVQEMHGFMASKGFELISLDERQLLDDIAGQASDRVYGGVDLRN